MLHPFLSNMILQPASQNFLVATNDECVSPGTMCALVTLLESHGMSRLHVCVDLITDPSGSLILSGLEVGSLFLTVAPFMMK